MLSQTIRKPCSELPGEISVYDFAILVEHLTNCLSERSSNRVLRSFTWIQEIAGFSHAIVCQSVKNGEDLELVNLINHSYDDNWINTYISENYSTVDPVIAYCKTQRQPFNWDDAYSKYFSRKSRKFANAARDHGLFSGISVGYTGSYETAPECRLSIGSLANVDNKRQILAGYLLRTFLPVWHDILATTARSVFLAQKLTITEMEVLKWAKEGKTVWEISTIRGVSESTVKFHFQNIYKKLDVNNRVHAIAKAIHLGVI